MTAPARLLSLRLQGFKSFAARTVVEFGPGISAVVGPNGSGKSNLADALRWVLGEQGRALRSRRSEDVIFAGSERRAALGMADVVLVLDNSDGLLPVDYSVLELGRRLYRSGENDYLLNRQRIRLRDLVDLLDSAHLADNAFLFIGQGMVDQALALRPEERRPLFEEVAGVRRHERRRRKAEEQLAEAETNLARVEDILAELRPQARRLAAQAEQQASRETAGSALAAGIIATAHARWYDTATRGNDAAARLAEARREVDRALAALTEGEASISALRALVAERAGEERRHRAGHEAALARVTGLRIREAHVGAERAALERDAQRIADERARASAELALRRRDLAEPVPAADRALESAVAEAARGLADAMEELAQLRAAREAEGEAERAVRRAEAARTAELDTARRWFSDATSRATDEREGARASRSSQASLATALADAAAATSQAIADDRSAISRHESARQALDAADAARRSAADRSAAMGARIAGLRGRLDLLEQRRAEEETRGIARAARRRGGRRLDDGLRVDPTRRASVEAALGEAARAYLVGRESVAALAGERGMLAIGVDAGVQWTDLARDPRAEALRRQVSTLGGGLLVEAIQHDPTGMVRALLGLAVWLPDLGGVLDVQRLLPPGAIAVDEAGSVVATRATIALGRPDGTLERRAEEERIRTELEATAGESEAAGLELALASQAVETARADVEAARSQAAAAAGEWRRAEERERSAGRDAEAAVREAAWHEAQAERLEQEAIRARTLVEELERPMRPAEPTASADHADGGGARGSGGTVDEGGPVDEGGNAGRDQRGVDDRDPRRDQVEAVDRWTRRVEEIQARHARLSADLAGHEIARRAAEARQARAQAGVAGAEERLARTDREMSDLHERQRVLEEAVSRLGAELADAIVAEAAARLDLERLGTTDETDRARLANGEHAAVRARDRLRSAEDRSRAAESADMQARLELDLVREQVLVELAGLGELGLVALGGTMPVGGRAGESTAESDAEPATSPDVDEGPQFEAALEVAERQWAAEPPNADRPSPGRLAWLRRRYHELGAANPSAVDEYEALRHRLDGLEAQERDLRTAIDSARQLIGELHTLIADQFRSTFRALEGAFDARFQQLFGGGFAHLSLTDADDLSATGVEIVARPPGKKAQALAMLSGGERALTAVALLFAMLEIRPVPFCVLDEVDAALDEANVGRFGEALQSLADRTQFVVITHNRGTIETADALYGVTVGEDSVSRVVSLRLDEATAIAAQHRTNRARVAGDPGAAQAVDRETRPGDEDELAAARR
ncbi:MAG TPA: AAA family ATPase [Candidatus Saccharimonadales bacterium]|nr:AAA family ATPase [Candidatus Saccharimonadales bacterium]